MDQVKTPPEVFLGAERHEQYPLAWYYHLGAPDPWVLVFVRAVPPGIFSNNTVTYNINAEFRLIGARSSTGWHMVKVDLDEGLAVLTLEIEARLTAAKRDLERGLEVFRNPSPDSLDFWSRLAG